MLRSQWTCTWFLLFLASPSTAPVTQDFAKHFRFLLSCGWRLRWLTPRERGNGILSWDTALVLHRTAAILRDGPIDCAFKKQKTSAHGSSITDERTSRFLQWEFQRTWHVIEQLETITLAGGTRHAPIVRRGSGKEVSSKRPVTTPAAPARHVCLPVFTGL